MIAVMHTFASGTLTSLELATIVAAFGYTNTLITVVIKKNIFLHRDCILIIGSYSSPKKPLLYRLLSNEKVIVGPAVG